MSRCAIYTENDREFYAGLDLGWSKQLRLAHVYADERTAMRTIYDWRQLGNELKFRLVYVHWRIRDKDGRRFADRGSEAECRALLDKYAGSGGWLSGPYTIHRVASVPKRTSEPSSKA